MFICSVTETNKSQAQNLIIIQSPHVRESGIQQIFAVGIRNPDTRMRNPQWFGIQSPLWYGIRNPEDWNPESKELKSRIQMLGSRI